MSDLEIRAMSAPWASGVEIMVRQGNSFGVNVAMQEVEPGIMVEPTMRIGRSQAQVLMDDLWQAGYRPTDGTGSAGSLLATERHLNDMRAIAFRKLNIPEVK